MSRVWFWLGLSFIVHFGLSLALKFVPDWPAKPTKVVEVELLTLSPSARPSPPVNLGARPLKSGAQSRPKTLNRPRPLAPVDHRLQAQNLLPSSQNTQARITTLDPSYFPRYQPQIQPLDANGDTYLSTPKFDNPGADWGSGAGTFERIEDHGFFDFLYRQIDSQLHYPGVLARNKIQGTINTRIVFTASGNCDWSQTKIQGHQPYLELYTLDVLKNVCKMNFKNYLKDREVTNADLSFHFELSEHNDSSMIGKQKLIVGNTLLFYRNSQRSIMEWELGPFRGMFPVPGVYLNIPWIQEKWESLAENKNPLDEFKKEFGGVSQN